MGMLLGGCSLLPPDLVSRTEAIEIALQNTQVSEPVVTEVRQGGLSELSGDPSLADSIVWAVTVQGLTAVCPPNVPNCAAGIGVSTIYVESETGDWIEITNGQLRPN